MKVRKYCLDFKSGKWVEIILRFFSRTCDHDLNVGHVSNCVSAPPSVGR